MFIKRYLCWLALAILVLQLGYAAYITQTTNIVLSIKHGFGLGMAVAALAAAFLKPRLGKVLTLVTLLLGVFDVIRFTPETQTFFLRIGIFSVLIQVFSLGVLLVFVATNMKSVSRRLEAMRSEEP
ncbi:hypothetical protein [Chitinophaga varians]|uniref:hypothetical protein n=1 Tax=Chitinophaga varians TaxID=2202339 RepID=UPI00165F5A05|nr:hypothetical protein [Chitinophaga varians]MBC9909779.1 hypothetical protein [Chitinophaga varians]